MFKDLIGTLVITAIRACAPMIRKKELEEYEKLKAKAAATPGFVDDAAVLIAGIAIGAEE